MNKKENEVIKGLLNLYPDVIEDLGGDAVANSDSDIERIVSYIINHKWFVNEKIPFTVTIEDAIFSWYENVYMPQKIAMNESNIYFILKQFSKDDLFKIVSDEYYYHSKSDTNYYYNNACYAVIYRESKSFFSRKIAQVKLARVS